MSEPTVDNLDGTPSPPPPPPVSPSAASDTFSLIDPPSPFPAHLVFSDPFGFDGASVGVGCGVNVGAPIKGGSIKIRRIWDVLAHASKNGKRAKTRRIRVGTGHVLNSTTCAFGLGLADGDGDILMRDPNVEEMEIMDSDEEYEGEETAEFIDDEACYLLLNHPSHHHHKVSQLPAPTVDFLGSLPTELALHILSWLAPQTILQAMLVSKEWNRLCNDSLVWRRLFLEKGWRVKPGYVEQHHSFPIDLLPPSTQTPTQVHRPPHIRTSSVISIANQYRSSRIYNDVPWRSLYRTRLLLENRFRSPTFIPDMHMFKGHTDSVYCLDFLPRATRTVAPNILITGSRDKTIKIWNLDEEPKEVQDTIPASLARDRNPVPGDVTPTGPQTGPIFMHEKAITLFGHLGSVLCLKFDETGFMVSGSSDCCALVWDLGWGPPLNEMEGFTPIHGVNLEGESTAAVLPRGWRTPRIMAVLKNHQGGVLDVKISEKWIVTCSRDGLVIVYHRSTLALHVKLRGHDGPVNSIGLLGDRVVSASGDTRMILWDISDSEKYRDGAGGGSGKRSPLSSSTSSTTSESDRRRLQTFGGHEKGLACVEFHENIIISGSNDNTIKIWCVETGRCVRTLLGHSNLVRALAYDSDIKVLVSGSYDKSVRVWDLGTPPSGSGASSSQLLMGMGGLGLTGVGEVATHGGGNGNANGVRSGSTENTADGAMMRYYAGLHKSNVFGVGFDCKRIFSAGHDRRVVMLDYGRGLDVDMFY